MTLQLLTVASAPFQDQKPGTGGLRKRVQVMLQPHYLENYLQAVLDVITLPAGSTVVLGGDGRHHNAVALQIAMRMLAAAGVRRVIVGRGGLLSTPAASHLIRTSGAAAGLILSASHNPAGPDGDFGVKLNMASGGPAPESVTDAIAARSREITGYRIAEHAALPLDREGEQRLGEMVVEVVNPVSAYAALMESLFDFPLIAELFASGFRMSFDAMHAVTGPYAREILEGRLGAAPGTVRNGEPREDFGGGHADPNLVHAHELVEILYGDDAPDFGAASDGDGDRNMILGRRFFVTPSDSLAVLTANADCVPAYRAGLRGVARSMPTSRAVDHVAQALGIPCYETPTGWKFFGTLLDAGRITLCGEESFGTGSDHVREKDGLWAVLFWLNVLAARRQSVEALVRAHWARFGRTYYMRYDYEEVPSDAAVQVMDAVRSAIPTLVGRVLGGSRVAHADEYAYVDPVDGSRSDAQGLRITCEDGARAVFRLSGTGTAGATVRLYLERHERDPARLAREPAEVLEPLAQAVIELSGLHERTGRTEPTVIT